MSSHPRAYVSQSKVVIPLVFSLMKILPAVVAATHLCITLITARHCSRLDLGFLRCLAAPILTLYRPPFVLMSS
ncbi:uncharacterized protein CC84DRAFT_154680 [Paraphaeosphaeria sporulosa]|uniref:Uncharacterized protein n=1 Tax=Paraphaeosphaeria sporulosa TaxID=1460663 RepID=A0A177D0F3_9PLEO|nr:uncharacterized protein CC84DRAFT_154680 [Paraphaeosphaeria sporulosa]OAG12642.1 hypothetical protein CC84DRAFT_154680 [Paraphaeosphaeria sporulosa]